MQRGVNDRGEKVAVGMPSGLIYVHTYMYNLTFKMEQEISGTICLAVLLTAVM